MISTIDVVGFPQLERASAAPWSISAISHRGRVIEVPEIRAGSTRSVL
jgi:hypothetical protein